MIYIFTQYDPFFTGEFLRRFDQKAVAYTVIDMPNFKRGKLAGVSKAVRLYGWIGLFKLIIIYVTRYANEKYQNVASWRHVDSNEQIADILTSLSPGDIVLSLSAPTRLPIELVDVKIPKINFHCGSLPKYAGMMPIFWQLFENESFITITMHELAEDIDTGHIINEERLIPVGSLFNISQHAKRISADMFFDFLNKNLSGSPIDTNVRPKSKLTKFPSSSDVLELRKKIKLI